MFYRKNLGTTERWLRFAAGALMSCCGFFVFGTAPLAWIVAASGLTTMATGVFGFCPGCALAGRKLRDASALGESGRN